jgi:hypothetical protein
MDLDTVTSGLQGSGRSFQKDSDRFFNGLGSFSLGFGFGLEFLLDGLDFLRIGLVWIF